MPGGSTQQIKHLLNIFLFWLEKIIYEQNYKFAWSACL